MKSMVIYPAGNLLDLLYLNRSHRGFTVVYGVEFDGTVVKVGKSKDPSNRVKQIVTDGEKLGLTPTRFFVTDPYRNAFRIERYLLDALRATATRLNTPEDFPAASEWFSGADLDPLLGLVQNWVPLPESPDIALLASDLAAKELAEANYLAAAHTAEVPTADVTA